MRALRSVVALTLVAGLAACGSDTSDVNDANDSPVEVTLHVLAAASLAETFDDVAVQFEADHPGVTVEPVYDSSGTLATQVIESAPADVLATADLESIGKVVTAGAAKDVETYARNYAILVAPAGNPAGVDSFADLEQATYVICVDTAPCGKVGAQLLASNDILAAPVSLEPNVKAVLTKVTSGEVDAGIVYVTDAQAAGDQVQSFEIPGAEEVPTDYGIAVVKQSEYPGLAHEFIDFVLSDAGEQLFRDAGFRAAP